MMCHELASRFASPAYDLKQPNCPRCGTAPFLPVVAEFAGDGRIRHTWVCEGCGHTYHTAIAIRQNERAVADLPHRGVFAG